MVDLRVVSALTLEKSHRVQGEYVWENIYCWWLRNPANQLRKGESTITRGFIHPRWCRGFLPSTVLIANYHEFTCLKICCALHFWVDFAIYFLCLRSTPRNLCSAILANTGQSSSTTTRQLTAPRRARLAPPLLEHHRISRDRRVKRKQKKALSWCWDILVGDFNPLEKYLSNWIISPNTVEHKKCLKPPPSI